MPVVARHIECVNDVFSLRQGSDRNGTPGQALSTTPGAPGVPGAPGTPLPPGAPGTIPVPGFPSGFPRNPFGGPTTGNTPPGTPLDPQGRPIR